MRRGAPGTGSAPDARGIMTLFAGTRPGSADETHRATRPDRRWRHLTARRDDAGAVLPLLSSGRGPLLPDRRRRHLADCWPVAGSVTLTATGRERQCPVRRCGHFAASRPAAGPERATASGPGADGSRPTSAQTQGQRPGPGPGAGRRRHGRAGRGTMAPSEVQSRTRPVAGPAGRGRRAAALLPCHEGKSGRCGVLTRIRAGAARTCRSRRFAHIVGPGPGLGATGCRRGSCELLVQVSRRVTLDGYR